MQGLAQEAQCRYFLSDHLNLSVPSFLKVIGRACLPCHYVYVHMCTALLPILILPARRIRQLDAVAPHSSTSDAHDGALSGQIWLEWDGKKFGRAEFSYDTIALGIRELT